jgi:hypothetical protein
MKKMILIVAMLVLAPSAVWADESPVSVSWTTGLKNQYILPEGILIHDQPVVENEIAFLGESGWHAGIYSAFPDESSLFFEGEVDGWVGYDHLVLDEKLSLGCQLTYLAIGELDESKDDQAAMDLRASLPKFPVIQPYLNLRYYAEVGDVSPEKGLFAFTGFTREQPLGFRPPNSEEEQTLDLGVEFVWTDGAMGLEPGLVCSRLTASADIALTKNCFLVPSFLWQIADSDQPEDWVDSEWVFGLNLRIDL